MYNLRTPTPRYCKTWDVSKVTDYLKTLHPLEQLNLKNLTLKTIMLCALVSAQREQTLCALDLNYCQDSVDCLSFVIAERLKTSKPGKSIEVTFQCLQEEPSVCAKCTLVEYISRTKALRGDVTKVFLSYIRPHKPVSTDTVARWIKVVMAKSGIDVSLFKAHSVRGASTSALYAKGVPIGDILRTADWSNERTFRKYYLRCNLHH